MGILVGESWSFDKGIIHCEVVVAILTSFGIDLLSVVLGGMEASQPFGVCLVHIYLTLNY